MMLLKDILPLLNDKEAYDNIRKVIKFIKDTLLKHFEWEEQEIFPIALALGELEIKQVVRELQQHHIIALSKFDIMSDLVVKHGFIFPDEEIKNKFVGAAKEMLEITLQNARKEDTELFPFLISKGIKLNLKGLLG
jgi:hemerythrin-like domain-containing protein